MIRKLNKALASPRLAWWLLVVLLACLLVSFVVPQRAIVGEAIYSAWRGDVGFGGVFAEALGLEAVFSSPLFLIAMALLFVNLAVCTLRRVAAHRHLRVRPLVAPDDARAFILREAVDGPERAKAMSSPGWLLRMPADGQYLWQRGVWGWRGSILMHIGLLVLLLAGLVSGFTRFSGSLVLTEGQTVTDNKDAYESISQTPRYGNPFTGAPLTLRDLQVTYQGSTIVDVRALMSAGPEGEVRTVRVNQPFTVAGRSYLLSQSGHAVAVKVKSGNDVLVDAVINLGRVSPRGFADSITLRPGTDIKMTVIPDAKAAAAGGVRRGLLLVDPVVEVQTSESTASIAIRPGESARVGSLTVEVGGVSFWTRLLARSDKGLPVVYLAFVMILAGVIVRWMDPDVKVAMVVSDVGATGRVWHRSRFSSAIGAKAVDRLIDEIGASEEEGVAC